MNPTLKRYAISSIITFVSMFLISVGAQLSMGAITADNLTLGAVLSIIFVALRAAIKAVVEAFAAPKTE